MLIKEDIPLALFGRLDHVLMVDGKKESENKLELIMICIPESIVVCLVDDSENKI